jgi:hypothetical protein
VKGLENFNIRYTDRITRLLVQRKADASLAIAFRRDRKIAEATITFITYVCLSVRPHGTTDFNEI